MTSGSSSRNGAKRKRRNSLRPERPPAASRTRDVRQGEAASGGCTQHPATDRVAGVPAIPLEVLDCTIYLYASEEAANRGEQAGGSGFLTIVPLSGHPVGYVYAVTNAHVIAKGFTCVRLNSVNSADGGHGSVALEDDAWKRHPDGDDLAVARLQLSSEFRFKLVSTDSFVGGDDPSLFGVGQEVYMAGRYVNGGRRTVPQRASGTSRNSRTSASARLRESSRTHS